MRGQRSSGFGVHLLALVLGTFVVLPTTLVHAKKNRRSGDAFLQPVSADPSFSSTVAASPSSSSSSSAAVGESFLPVPSATLTQGPVARDLSGGTSVEVAISPDGTTFIEQEFAAKRTNEGSRQQAGGRVALGSDALPVNRKTGGGGTHRPGVDEAAPPPGKRNGAAPRSPPAPGAGLADQPGLVGEAGPVSASPPVGEALSRSPSSSSSSPPASSSESAVSSGDGAGLTDPAELESPPSSPRSRPSSLSSPASSLDADYDAAALTPRPTGDAGPAPSASSASQRPSGSVDGEAGSALRSKEMEDPPHAAATGSDDRQGESVQVLRGPDPAPPKTEEKAKPKGPPPPRADNSKPGPDASASRTNVEPKPKERRAVASHLPLPPPPPRKPAAKAGGAAESWARYGPGSYQNIRGLLAQNEDKIRARAGRGLSGGVILPNVVQGLQTLLDRCNLPAAKVCNAWDYSILRSGPPYEALRVFQRSTTALDADAKARLTHYEKDARLVDSSSNVWTNVLQLQPESARGEILELVYGRRDSLDGGKRAGMPGFFEDRLLALLSHAGASTHDTQPPWAGEGVELFV
ncbi:unnamed protein product [Amoebophrya sp. A25]|nr:unnamed protein product [Amoebophrya sp. A25]|eukprot:GSA25T00017259001.1